VEHFSFIQDLMLECCQELEGRFRQRTIGVPTGFPRLDRMIDGLAWGELVVLGGSGKSGKTALALDMVRHAAVHAKDKASVAIFSVEETEQFIAQRLLAAEAGAELRGIMTGERMTPKQWVGIGGAADLLAEADIVIDHTPDIALRMVCERCTRLKALHGPVDMVVIDSLESTRDGHEAVRNMRRRREMMKGLRDMTKDLDVALLVVSESPGGTEGASFDEFADKVLLLHREENCNEAELIVAQNACGDTGAIALSFRPEFASFESRPVANTA